METAFIILGIATAVFALLALAALPVYFRVFYNKKRDVTREVLRGPDYDPHHDRLLKLIDDALKIPFESVYVRAYDGKKLFGRVYMQTPGAPFHIQFHGYKGNGIRDFSGGLQLALSTGGNVLLIDHRSHGLSGLRRFIWPAACWCTASPNSVCPRPSCRRKSTRCPTWG